MHVPSLSRWAATFAASVLLTACGTAAPEDLYRQLQARYDAAQTLQSTATLTLTLSPADGQEPMISHLDSAFARPASLRIDSTRPDGGFDTRVISDGETLWQVIEEDGTPLAVKAPAPARLSGLQEDNGPVVPGILGDLPLLGEFALFAGSSVSADELTITIADEPEDVGGVPCDILTLTPADGLVQRIAIGRDDGLLRRVAVDLQSPHGNQTLQVVWAASEVTLDAEIPATQFAYQPPAEQKVYEAATIGAALEQMTYGIGEPAPAFTLTNLDGQEVSLDQFRGKPVVIDFWATWCGPCEQQQPALKKLRDTYGDRIAIVMISNETPEEVRPVVTERKLGMVQLTNPDNDVLEAFGVEGFPTTFFVDSEGIARAVHYGVDPNQDTFATYQAEVEAMLK